jgi:hypothetical protein
VAFLATDMSHESDPASIVLMGSGIQTVVFKVLDFGCRGHGALLKIALGTEDTAMQQKCQVL